MKYRSGQIRKKVCFLRWSRKSYALFACLGKEVVIGMLKYRLVDTSVQTGKKPKAFDLFTNEHKELGPSEEKLVLLSDKQMGLLCLYRSVEKTGLPVKNNFYCKYNQL